MERGDGAAASVKSVARAIDVLQTLADGPRHLGATADRLSLPKGTVHRLLTALVERGLVAQDPISKTYALGPGCLRIADAVMQGHSALVLLARPVLDNLARATGESVTLQVRMGLERVYVATVSSEQPFRYVSRVGATVPLHAGAAGRCLLAFLPSSERRSIITKMPFVRFTERTVPDKETLARELARVRSKGYAITTGEHTAGATSAAAPVFVGDELVAALTAGGPTLRLPKYVIDDVRKLVVQEASRLSETASRLLPRPLSLAGS